MRIVLQRVASAEVEVGGQTVSRIGRGLLLLVAMEEGDDPGAVARAAAKVSTLRVFGDAAGRMNLDVSEIGGEVLVVSQFTLAASMRRGRRPSFTGAMPPDRAQPQIEALVECLRREHGLSVAEGMFGAAMQVTLVNDGPVTLVIDF